MCRKEARRNRRIRVIVHLSDLHFGHVDLRLIAPLVKAIRDTAPSLVAVSGDFTQHAWPHEFIQAREFLERLPQPQILVPGNHDMAFYNPLRRATQRLKLYRRYITEDRQPFYGDKELTVLGLNTVRVSHLRDGRIRTAQVLHLEEKMRLAGPETTRVLVTHHPFDLPESYHYRELIGRHMIARIAASVDLLLAGHMHLSHAGQTATRYNIAGHSAVFVQAGTALSTRIRGEANSFQVIRIEAGTIVVEQFEWDEDWASFTLQRTQVFRKGAAGWAQKAQDEVTTGPAPL